MKKINLAIALMLSGISVSHAATTYTVSKEWGFTHSGAGYLSEIPAYDAITHTVWVAGVKGVDVLNATNGSLVQRIDTSAFGNINSVSIKNGLAAFAIENVNRSQAGLVQLYDTSTRSLASGTNSFTVGSLPDMVTFTPDGKKILVANEATPTFVAARRADATSPAVPEINHYGVRTSPAGATPISFGTSVNDPVGSVTIIDVTSRSVANTATFAGVTTTGTHIRTNTGMDFEPEYIAVNASGTKAYVTLQEANAIGILDLNTNSFEKVVGLGVKDFNLPGNQIDPRDRTPVGDFKSVNVKGFYMPDSIATYESKGVTYLVTANEGDYREDDADRDRASTINVSGELSRLQVSLTDSTATDLYVAGTRSFSIRDADGNFVYDSGDILDKEAARLGIYDDGRSDDKGVEPEGITLLNLLGRTIAAVGLERTTTGAIALFDITDPTKVSFIEMIKSTGDNSPEGMFSFVAGGKGYIGFSNEGSNTTSLFSVTAVPEPESYAMFGLGLGLLAWARRRQA